MVSTPQHGLKDLFEIIPEYLKKPLVLAMGEIGFEPNSPTCSDLDEQKKIFRG